MQDSPKQPDLAEYVSYGADYGDKGGVKGFWKCRIAGCGMKDATARSGSDVKSERDTMHTAALTHLGECHKDIAAKFLTVGLDEMEKAG
ncbi:MAG: hypothetical protein JF609_01485 [Verrucomicrobia bacterium]|nr:hypothetical protein [Verrucomicrobiota bacterium]